MISKQKLKRIRPPKNKSGYTLEEIKKIFGSNTEAVLGKMIGCTVPRNREGQTVFPSADVRRAWDIVRKGYSEIPWD